MIVIEAYCDKCGSGLLQKILQTGFDLGISSSKLANISCDCGHENVVEDTVTVIPNEFFVYSNAKDKYKKDESVKNFLKD